MLPPRARGEDGAVGDRRPGSRRRRAPDRPPARAARRRCRASRAPTSPRCGASRRAAWCGSAAPVRRAPRASTSARRERARRSRADQEAALARDRGRARPATRPAAARRDRLGQDRGLPARRGGGARPRAAAHRARARDRADAADRLALRRPLRRHGRRAALQARAGRAPRRVGAPAPRRGARSASARARRSSRRSSDLGLVVVDEEHDASYKHEGDPRYDARRVAERRARRPAPCSSPAARRRGPRASTRCARLRLPARVDGRRLPPVEIVDMREAARAVHPRTHEALVDARKAIVLLNRRGWSNFLTCRVVRAGVECPSCDVTLVLHRARRAAGLPPLRPPRAGARALLRVRLGLDRAPRDRDRAPGAGARRARCSASTPTSRDPARRAAPPSRPPTAACSSARRWSPRATTSPTWTLGVVLDADATLRFPDFRAEERTFALVAQLAGRAGPRRRAAGACSCRRSRPRPSRSAWPPPTTPTASWPASSSAARRCATRRSRR